MARFLIIQATKYGSTERIARRIAGVLEAAGHAATVEHVERLPADLAPASFDAVVVAAPVYVGKYAPPVHRFVTAHRDTLNARPSAFVSVCGGAASPAPKARAEAEGYATSFLAATGWRPRATSIVAGTIAYTKYDFLTRLLLKLIAMRNKGDTDTSRDWEYTDWAAVEAFASRLAADVR